MSRLIFGLRGAAPAGLGSRRLSSAASDKLPLTSLTAISALDGRYASKTEALRPYFSEYGLIKHRVQVEVRWLQLLADTAAIAEVPAMAGDSALRGALDAVVADFGEADAKRVKEIESTTNHDVKAVEYFLKEKVEGFGAQFSDLTELSEFVHFACTSEDINNLSYALMLKEAKQHVMAPAMDSVVAAVGEVSKRRGGRARNSRRRQSFQKEANLCWCCRRR